MAVMNSLRRLDDRVLPIGTGNLVGLQRSGHDRHLAGVCGGLGRATGTDARIWRAAFVVLLPITFWVYALAWLFLPMESNT